MNKYALKIIFPLLPILVLLDYNKSSIVPNIPFISKQLIIQGITIKYTDD